MVALVASVSAVSVVDREGHQRAGAVDDLDVLDDADLDARDADVVALDHAGGVDELGLVLAAAPNDRLPIVITSTPVASVVTRMKISSLDRSTAVFLSRELHRRLTSAPRAIGPTSSAPRSRDLVGGDAEARRRAGDLSSADSSGLPA